MELRLLCCVVWLAGCADDVSSTATDGTGSSGWTEDATSGSTGNDATPTPECERPSERGQWLSLSSLPEASTSFALDRDWDGTPLLVGGQECETGGAAVGTQVLRWADGMWSSDAELPEPRVKPRLAVFPDGVRIVLDGNGEAPVLRSSAEGWDVLNLSSVEMAPQFATTLDADTVLVAEVDTLGSRWFRSDDRGDTWAEDDGPQLLAWEVPNRLNRSPSGAAFVTSRGSLVVSDATSAPWTEVAWNVVSSASVYDESRLFVVEANDCCQEPTGAVPRRASARIVDVSDPEAAEDVGFACPAPINASPEVWEMETHAAGASRAFVLSQRTGWVYDADGWHRLPELPPAERWIAVEDGTLLGVGDEDCRASVWQWVPE